MAVGLSAPQDLLPVAGLRLAATHCGIKKDPAIKDIVLIELVEGSSVAAVFTKNKFCAAPVTICRRHLQSNQPRFLLINSGNANAGTGQQGEDSALACCQTVADTAGINRQQVLPFSTGVIGSQLAVEKMQQAIPQLCASLDSTHWLAAAEGIMTTDTLPKAVSRQVEVSGQQVTITGISKGSGMIQPDMATMLAYIATDAEIEPAELRHLLQFAAQRSFNAISVDGDTSTNDSCLLMATAASGVTVDRYNAEFVEALLGVFQHLAQAVIRDGEGATKFVEVRVTGAVDDNDARQVAFTVANSPLVKTALFASDPNWGRILMAVGRAPVENMQIDKTNLFIGDVCLIRQGLPDPDYTEAAGQAVFNRSEIVITIDLSLGEASTSVWTSDLSYEYVKINAEYRS